jgi:hypothetical protein
MTGISDQRPARAARPKAAGDYHGGGALRKAPMARSAPDPGRKRAKP